MSKEEKREYDKKYYLKNRERKSFLQKIYSKTLSGFVTKTYATQRSTSKHRGHPMPEYSKQELKDYLHNSTTFVYLWQEWVDSGYNTRLRPSIDRVDFRRHYTLDNIQLITWEENNIKGILEANSIKYKPVKQYDLKGNYIDTFCSMVEAATKTNTNKSDLSCCCRGKYKTAGGFIWKFKNK